VPAKVWLGGHVGSDAREQRDDRVPKDKAEGPAKVDSGPKLTATELPAGLDKEQRLNYVIGLVSRQAAMAEDATFSVLRALKKDFILATGQQTKKGIAQVIELCVERYTVDSRLAEMKVDAIGLLSRAKASAEKRNELVHSLWSVSDDPVDTRYQTLKAIELVAQGRLNPANDSARTIGDLGAVCDDLRVQQISLNFLKFRTIHAFNSYRIQDLQWYDPDVVGWFDKVIRGEFDLTETGFALWDRELANRLSTGR